MKAAKIGKRMAAKSLASLNLKKECFDLVVGIGSGGKIPARLVAEKLKLPLRLVEMNFRGNENKPARQKPILLKPIAFDFAGKRILLVDDFCNIGKTLEAAKKECAAQP